MQLPRSQRHILHSLKTRGPQSVRILSRQLEMTTMGVRHHLADLNELGLAHQMPAERQHRGRPVSLWKLTDKGHAWFPNSGAALARELIQVADLCWGDDGVERLVEERTGRVEQRYREAMRGPDDDLHEKVGHLVNLRSADGYMAGVRLLPDGWLLVQNHCPIQACAENCPHFCKSEQDMFQQLLGAGASVERTDHLLAGDRRCAWRIRRVAAAVEKAA